MPQTHGPAQLLVEQLPFIRRAAHKLCLRHGLNGDDIEEFISWATEKLVEDDYATLRKFQKKSSITTFLTVVLRNLYGDYRNKVMGRWRPSAEARRQGEDAMELEELVYRDGHSVPHAVARVRASGKTKRTERQLFELFDRLPDNRGRPKPVRGDEWLTAARSADHADAAVLASEVHEDWQELDRELGRALARLPAEDALIVRMHFHEDLSLAAIARALKLEQKPLYRRLGRILSQLRNDLARAGISSERFSELFAESKNDS